MSSSTTDSTSKLVAQPMTPADCAPSTQALARAFADDPVMTWLCGRRQPHFTELAPAFFEALARPCMLVGGAWTITDHRAVALWVPPGVSALTPLALAQGMFPATRLFARRIGVALALQAALERKQPREPHWYLRTLGTDPSHQGYGYGSTVITPVLDRCDRDGLPAYLESSKERNLPFYERHGFRTTQRIDFMGGQPMWLMWRPPV